MHAEAVALYLFVVSRGLKWSAFSWQAILFLLLFQVSRSAELQAKWKHCAITQQPLLPPIVACELGRWVWTAFFAA